MPYDLERQIICIYRKKILKSSK